MSSAGAAARVFLVAAAVAGCGEQVDELGPYVEQLRQMDKYNKKLVEYRFHLKSDQASKAAGLRETIKSYLADMEAFGHTKDKFIKAGHNALKRALQSSLTKLVEPDFPTFTISGLRQIDLIEEGYTVHVENLDKLWAEEDRTGETGLAWPGQD